MLGCRDFITFLQVVKNKFNNTGTQKLMLDSIDHSKQKNLTVLYLPNSVIYVTYSLK